MVYCSHPYMTTGKTIAFNIQTFVNKDMSLLFNILSRFVIAFLPRSKRLLISRLLSPSTVILEPKKTVCHCFHFFSIYSSTSVHTYEKKKKSICCLPVRCCHRELETASVSLEEMLPVIANTHMRAQFLIFLNKIKLG